MKRDMDLIRRIVLQLVEPGGPISSMEGVTKATFFEHVMLLTEAGLIESATTRPTSGPGTGIALRLTWDGQEFAEMLNDDTIWRKAVDKVITPGASWSFQILGEVLAGLIRQKFGL